MKQEKLERLLSLCEAFARAANTSREVRDSDICRRIEHSPASAVLAAHVTEKREAANDKLEEARQAVLLAQEAGKLTIFDVNALKQKVLDLHNQSHRYHIESIDLFAARMLLGVQDKRAALWIPEEFKNEQNAADLDSIGAKTLARLCRLGQRPISIAL